MNKLKQLFFTLICTSIALSTFAQQPKFEVKFSESLAVYVFVQNLSDNYPDNPFKTVFVKSAYYQKKYKDLITQFDSINVSYNYQFEDFPFFSKMPGRVDRLIKKNLIECTSLEDFKLRSTGLIPNVDLLKLTAILSEFLPAYQQLIYNPNKDKFENQLKSFSEYIKLKDVPGYFRMGLKFYNTVWDNSIPLKIAFYPLPNSKGFTAEAFDNYAVSAIQTDLKNYDVLLSVMLHEVFHIIYDEQSLTVKRNLTGWFKSNPLPSGNYAYLLMNEALATVLGNGYVYAKLSGQVDTTDWYHQKYINLMAKKIYPLANQYILANKPMDKDFVNAYIKIYQDNFRDWTKELTNLMTYRFVLTDDETDFNVIGRNYPYASFSEYEENISQSTLDKIKITPVTKLIIVANEHKNKLQLIKKSFVELKDWNYDANKEFTCHFFLNDKTQLIIINKVTSSTIDLLNKTFN
jgi:hypothetical protein